jgi:hypothetical protein
LCFTSVLTSLHRRLSVEFDWVLWTLLTEELQYEEMMDVSSEIVADQAAINRYTRFGVEVDIDSALEKYRGMRARYEH